jgi:uncharacterized protein (DUF362 family)/Pyruvate/2-oxoacid:ferredoxin oxidoreductase delta subunit
MISDRSPYPFSVSLARCADYDDARVRAAVEAALAPLGGLGAFIKPGQRVLVKLNLLLAVPPERGVTTHPAVVKAVVRMIQELGATPEMGDSPGGVNTPAAYAALLRKTGMAAVSEETGCATVHFDAEVEEVAPAAARLFHHLTVVKAASAYDAIIAIPKMKTHQFMAITGAVKLLYGFLPGLNKIEYHLHAGTDPQRFAELLVDICESFPPVLHIMDAITAMEGNGPSHGTLKPVHVIAASPSAYAMDYAMCALLGLDPRKVPTVRVAHERGVGPGSLKDVTLLGEPFDSVKVTGFQPAPTTTNTMVPPWATRFSAWLFAPRPEINTELCVRCGVCAKSCPAKTIEFDAGRVPMIQHRRCIRCYCCHELCPKGAVYIAPPRVSFARKKHP